MLVFYHNLILIYPNYSRIMALNLTFVLCNCADTFGSKEIWNNELWNMGYGIWNGAVIRTEPDFRFLISLMFYI